MDGTYDILLGGESAGNARVTREGLYNRFDCSLRLSGEVMYKLTVTGSNGSLDLGVPAPNGQWFSLTTRIPVKRVGEGPFSFRAVPKHAKVGNRFVPLKEDEPFRYLSKLNDATFAIQNGQPGIMLPEDE